MSFQTRYSAMLFSAAGVMLLSMALATAAARMGQGSGVIAAIEPASQTVVIEVPLGKEKLTVGGPLSPKASVKKGGKTVRLDNLRVGDHVRISWRQTANGQEITQLETR